MTGATHRAPEGEAALGELKAALAGLKNDHTRLEGKIETGLAGLKNDHTRLEGKIETGLAGLKSELASKADLKELKSDIFKVARLVGLYAGIAAAAAVALVELLP